jgi:hypothetical protein
MLFVGVHCHKVCQWLATGLWISLGPPISATKVVTEIFVKVVLNILSSMDKWWAQVQLRWKVIVLLILMEFMIIIVYKLSFHINQWRELVCWKYVFCWGSLDGICISCEVPSIVDTTLGISEQYLFFCHQTGMVGHWI